MINIAVLALTLCVGGMAGWFIHNHRTATWSSESRAPTIEQIQQLASLTVLHVPVADVQIYTLTGYTGGIQAVLVVRGDVEISTDLTAARLEAVDADHRQAYLVLPAPTAVRPRVDHERTRIYKIDRSGLWQMIPGEAGERDLVNRALQDAQRLIGEVGGQAELIDQARSRTKDVIMGFFRALGWQVETRWLDQRAATPATVESTPSG
jgi:hypothetical protein